MTAMASSYDSTAEHSGLLVDEFPERIPNTVETTGIAFHYEEPKNRAPQALLLAICPDNRPAWEGDGILAILNETIELAKIRTVDLDGVVAGGEILPALYFAFNTEGDTVSARLIDRAVKGD